MNTLRYYLRLLRDTSELDILDLNYVTSSKDLDLFSYYPAEFLPKPGLLRRVCGFWKMFLVSFAVPFRRKRLKDKPPYIFFFIRTDNHKHHLQPLADTMPNSIITGLENKDCKSCPNELIAYIISVFYFGHLLKTVLRCPKNDRLCFDYFLGTYWVTYGYYFASRLWFRKHKPQAVIFANDHAMYNRSALKAARDENIKTIYIQHSSVTENFPALEFDYALLQGMDTVNKYEKAGPSTTRVLLVGAPNTDSFNDLINTNNHVTTIGICSNDLTPEKTVADICRHIRDRMPKIKMHFRPHPAEVQLFPSWIKLSAELDMTFSHPVSEAPLEFIEKVDAIVSGDSNILLEAAYMNVFPLYYDFSGDKMDFYGFIKRKLVKYTGEPDELIRQLSILSESKPNVRDKARYYHHTLNTPFEGHSATLSGKIINAVGNNSFSLKGWKRVENTTMETYEPDDNSIIK